MHTGAEAPHVEPPASLGQRTVALDGDLEPVIPVGEQQLVQVGCRVKNSKRIEIEDQKTERHIRLNVLYQHRVVIFEKNHHQLSKEQYFEDRLFEFVFVQLG